MTIAEFDVRLAEWVGSVRDTGSLVFAMANDPSLMTKLIEMVEAEEVRMVAAETDPRDK
jgi:hypothetical protein